MQINNNNLPTVSILLLPDKIPRYNYFNSRIFQNLQKKNNNENDDESKYQLVKDLEDILLCCICLQYLDNPVNDPTCCSHYACKSCFDKYFKKKNSNTIPCPICRGLIKKKNLIKIPIVESIKDLLKDMKNNRMNDNNIKIEEKCKAHPNNQIFYICLDCQAKMCPICNEERMKHLNHQLVNYERYVKLFNFIQTSFTDIKENIKERETIIKEYKDLYILLEQQKNSYLECLSDISSKIQNIYKENQDNINKKIGESMRIIAKYKNFMLNIKTHISSQFKKYYDDIENLEEIKKEIKKRVDKLKLKEINKNETIDMKNKSIKNLKLILFRSTSIKFDKNQFMNVGNLYCSLDEKRIYTFGLQLSEDHNTVIAYLDIKKLIDNEPNYSSYIVCIEYGLNKKKLYLKSNELNEVNNEYYSYAKSLLAKELIDNNETNFEISLQLLSINLQ